MVIERYYEKKLEDGGVHVTYDSKTDAVSVRTSGMIMQHFHCKRDEVERIIKLLQEIIKPEEA